MAGGAADLHTIYFMIKESKPTEKLPAIDITQVVEKPKVQT